MRSLGLLLSLFPAAIFGQEGGARPALSDGVVSYTAEDGRRTAIQVGKKCDDLWVAPDESVLAFIAINKSRNPDLHQIEPYIVESSIYVARKADHYKPVRVDVKVKIDGREWKVARKPKVSPDLATVYFFVPSTMTNWTLTSVPFSSSSYKTIADASDYCVVWGGSRSGDLIILTRRDPSIDDPGKPAGYPCYVRSRSGAKEDLADECFVPFSALSKQWSQNHDGDCH